MWAAPCENVSLSTCGQLRPRSACASAQSAQVLHCPLTESLDTTECMNGEQMPGSYFSHAQDDVNLQNPRGPCVTTSHNNIFAVDRCKTGISVAVSLSFFVLFSLKFCFCMPFYVIQHLYGALGELCSVIEVFPCYPCTYFVNSPK